MKKVFYIILISALIVGYIVFSIYFTKNNSNGIKYLFIGNDSKWEFNKKWINFPSKSINSIDLSKYKVYNIGNQALEGTYDLYYNKQLYMKKNNDIVDLDNNYLLYKGDNKFNIIDYKLTKFSESDYNILSLALKQLDINGYNNLNLKKKVDIDLNHDGKIETIYCVSNMFSDSNEDKYFSLIYIYDDENIQFLFKDITLEKNMNSRSQNRIYSILDVDDDGQYEIITINSGFSLSTSNKYSMFVLENDKYKNVITSD